MRSICHVDMDAFYAAVEAHDRPELRGLPLIIAHLGKRGVVSTASYEARKFGVGSAMPTVTAQRLCPHGVIIEPRMARYTEVSRVVFEVFAEVTPQIEGLSLDEAFLDITASLSLFGGAQKIAEWLKSEIFKRTGLRCSVGLAHNKLLAKIACERNKPDGLFWLKPEAISATLDPMPVAKLWTIGKVAAGRLAELGIHTIGELRNAPSARVQKALGTQALSAQALARGEDERAVLADREEKSIGAEQTFAEDLTALSEAKRYLMQLSERVGERTRAQHLAARTLTVKLRVPPFETMTRQAQLPEQTACTDALYQLAERLLSLWWTARGAPRLRLLGISVSHFEAREAPRQAELFANPAHPPKLAARDSLSDAINQRFGKGALKRGRGLVDGS